MQGETLAGGPSARPAFSTEDLFLVATALRRERANRIWIAKRRGHRAKAIEQLAALEATFTALARARHAAADASAARELAEAAAGRGET